MLFVFRLGIPHPLGLSFFKSFMPLYPIGNQPYTVYFPIGE